MSPGHPADPASDLASDPASDPASAWVADPQIGWRILLTIGLAAPIGATELERRLDSLHLAQDWGPRAPVVAGTGTDRLAERLTTAYAAPLRVATTGRTVVVSAHHSHVDGLGLLAVASHLLGTALTSDARGVSGRPPAGGSLGTTVRRLGEAALRPPAGVAGVPPAAGSVPAEDGDVLVDLTVPARVRTTELVHAATAAVVARNEAAGRRTRHVAVAIGAGRPAPVGAPIADRSALIRLTDLEGASREDVARRLRSAPLQPPPATGGATRLAGTAMRLLSRRLGSTLLVSHLGEVTGAGVESLAFHPVTAGGTGLSLGAVTRSGRTTVTLRGRGHRWAAPDLAGLLGDVADRLGS